MAKGWESKSVEAQIEAAQSKVRRPPQKPIDPAQIDLLRKKQMLNLSRTRVMRDLESSVNPRYQQMLRRALADLDEQLIALDGQKAAVARA
jgi:hypothetical protein